MTGQNSGQMTKFFSMNDNRSTFCNEKSAGFIQKMRNFLSVLQEMDFERNEEKVRKILEDDREFIRFPIPFFFAGAPYLAVYASVPAGVYHGPLKRL